MGYFMIFLAMLSWSFVGILVKAASTMLDSTTITFARFFIGTVFLGIFLLIKDRGIKPRFSMKWIWIGAIGKSVNYFFENWAISIGYSFGNILVGPVQTIVLLIISVMFFKEKFTPKAMLATVLCVFGVLVISWNGMPLAELIGGNSLTTMFYLISGVGATFHVLSQKVLVKDMDSVNMNFSVFLCASIIMIIPLPWQFHFTGNVSLPAVAALLLLGLITGLSFYWFAEALKKVSLSVAVIISNTGVLFTILWSFLFYRDPITLYILGGSVLIMVGLVVLNIPERVKLKVKAVELEG